MTRTKSLVDALPGSSSSRPRSFSDLPISRVPKENTNEESSSSLSFVLSLLLFAASLTWTLALIVLWQATLLARNWHPAAALLCLGAAVHASVLLQGTRVALPSLVALQQEQQQSMMMESLAAASHPWTHAACQRAQQQQTSSSSLRSLDMGAQGLLVLLTMSAAPVATRTSVLGCPTWLVTATSVVACSLWWSVALQMATACAKTRRLDWLNTPVTAGIWYASTTLERCGLWYIPQAILPAWWQAWAEKPSSPEDSSHPHHHDWQARLAWNTLRFMVSLVATVLSTAVVSCHVLAKYGVLGTCAVLGLLMVAAIVPSIPLAAQQLSARECEVACIRVAPHQGGRGLLTCACWISVAFFLTSHADERVLYSVARIASAVMIVTATSQGVQSWARSFPVAFLTSSVVQAMDRLAHVLTNVTAVAPLLVPLVYPSYQVDAVYLGDVSSHAAADIESRPPKKTRIDSYPELFRSKDPLVFEEHAF